MICKIPTFSYIFHGKFLGKFTIILWICHGIVHEAWVGVISTVHSSKSQLPTIEVYTHLCKL